MNDAWSNGDTVAEMLQRRVDESPHAVAFWQETSPGHWLPIDWEAFGARVRRLRDALHAAGLRHGDRLALIAPVSLEWELLHHAALALGVVVVGMDAHDLPQRIAKMCAQAGVTAVATTEPGRFAALLADQHGVGPLLINLGESHGPSPEGKRALSWAELDAMGDAKPEQTRPPAAEDIATIIYTSGTTGEPKGIAYSHRQVCMAVDDISEIFDFIGHESRLLCWLPLSNLFQRMVNLAGMRRGAASYLLADPRRIMQVVATVSPDIFVGVPRFYEKLYDGIREQIDKQPAWQRKLVDMAWNAGRRNSRCRLQGRRPKLWQRLTHSLLDRMVLRRVRGIMGDRLQCMISGSAPISPFLLEEFHALGWLTLEAYGLSENVLPMAMNRVHDFRFGSVGRPLARNQIVLAADGAIKVRGPGLLNGYLGETPGLRLDPDGYFRTEDFGEYDSDGYLRLTGRSGELIKTSTGRRVAPVGVEAQLRSVRGIDQAVVLGNGRKYLLALCTTTDSVRDDASRLRVKAALHDRLLQINEHERPRGIALMARPFGVDTGELTPNLKVRRGALETLHRQTLLRLVETIDTQPSGEVAIIG